ncbi:MAG: hypothetical protein SFX72_15375 [Isosphaeraceae bacterium]|nr:hypothetical protein [Isosphaeraceae bacterium]
MNTTTIPQASIFMISSHRKTPISESKLEAWRKTNPSTRKLETIHDSIVARERIDLAGGRALDDLLLAVAAAEAAAPSVDRSGATCVVVVELGAEANSLIEAISGRPVAELPGGIVADGLRLFDLPGPTDRWLLVYENEHAADALSFARAALRDFAFACHKVADQFALYRSGRRAQALEAERTLRDRVEAFAFPRESVNPRDRCDAASRAALEIAEAYRKALLGQGDAARVEAMLVANLRNLELIASRMGVAPGSPGAALLARRIEEERLGLDQVRADLGLIGPTVVAAESIARLCHGEVQASLTLVEARENEIRVDQGRRADRNNRRLVLVGLWIGLTQIAVGWNSCLPERERYSLPTFLTWVIIIPALAVGITLIRRLLRREGNASKPSRNRTPALR